MTTTLDGPRRPARNGTADTLVVLVHGYGANGADLIGLADPLGEALPGASFVAPDAPEAAPGVPGGRRWFPIHQLDPAMMESGVRLAAPALESFVEAECAAQGVDPRRLALVGFSQGAMMTLHVGPRRARQPAAVVGFSGALCGPAALKQEAVSRPPILLVHGDRDDVVPVAYLWEAATGLAAAELPALWHVSVGVPHGIAPDGLELAARFLTRALARVEPAP